MGECFFWYRLTRVVRTKGRETVVVVVVVVVSVLYFVQQLCTVTHTHEQFLKLTVALGFFRFRFVFMCCFYHFIPVFFAVVVLGLVLSVLSQEIG